MDRKPTVEIHAEVIEAAPITPATVRKDDKQTALASNGTSLGWISRPISQEGLRALVEDSTILPQCIQSYATNIAGFGLSVDYVQDVKETDKMGNEFIQLNEIISNLCKEKPLKELFEDVIRQRETYGIAYIEVIRDVSSNVVRLCAIDSPPTVEKSVAQSEYVTGKYPGLGETPRRFWKYRQTVGTKTIYFKAFGDSRHMDKDTGEYKPSLAVKNRANELLEFRIGSGDYGYVRWMGQMLGIDGSKKAENLNNSYFRQGRHTPLALLVQGGTLNEESIKQLRAYINGVQGAPGQHKFLLLQTESDSETGLDVEKPKLEIKSLADILQHDELFQDYIENNRRRIQSAFRLPDLYVGMSKDYNRSTVQTIKETTEEQVFKPERENLAWVLNKQILACYGFTKVWASFEAPKISNPEDLARILTIAERAGGLPPNKAKEVAYRALNSEFEPYPNGWGNMPLAAERSMPTPTDVKPVQKSAPYDTDEQILGVLKELRKMLERSDDSANANTANSS
ncbi:MAG: phage portal protein [Oscillospiraceae bacterium]|jgi:PBSX family phage portal protein|nr:phage portal protein [Oscillospiraceae bacterium]